MNTKTCCVTGHRDIPEGKLELVKDALRKEIAQAVEDGYTLFISGFAQGADLMFASIVAEFKEQRPDLFLEAAIPYANRLKSTDELFCKLLKVCNGIKVECDEYNPSCFMKRNRYMVLQSQRVIAVYDGRERGGTLFTMRYAHAMEREVRVIQI